MNNLPCEMIQDLLPLYVDSVVGEEAKQAVEDHVKNCAACRQMLADMSDTGIEEMADASVSDTASDPQKKIDFMKKNRLMMKRIRLASSLCSIAFMTIAIGSMLVLGILQ